MSKENLGKQYDAAAIAEAAKNDEKLMTLEELRAEAEELANEANAAIGKNKMTEYAGIIARLTQTVNGYNDLAQREVFAACRAKENPKLEAAKLRYIDTIHVKITNNPATKMPARVDIEDRKAMIDLLKLCEFCALPTVWWTTVEAYAQYLALQKSSLLGVNEDRKKYLIEKFKISDDAKKVDMTRFSNSEKVAVLQAVVDEMVFVPGKTEGKNALRVNNHDVDYIDMCLTREGKAACEVKFSDGKAFRRILTNVCHRLAINGIYVLNYKEIKPKPVPIAPVISEKVVVPTKVSASESVQEEPKQEGVTRVKKTHTKKADQPKQESAPAPAAE